MAEQSHKYKLGLFVISAVTLLLATLIVLGGREWTRKKFKTFTCFAESVQGLEVGSPVKFRGVPIGSVTRIAIQDDSLNVRVDMELYEAAVKFQSKAEVADFIERMVMQGARCRLELAGITGAQYIGMDFYDDIQTDRERWARPADAADEEAFYIPAVPSLLTGIANNFSYTMYKLSQVDFAKIGSDLSLLLATMNTYLDDGNLGTIVHNMASSTEELKRILQKVDGALDKADIQGTTQQLKTVFESVEEASREVTRQLRDAQVAQVSADVRALVQKYATLPDELTSAVGQFNASLGLVRKLTTQVEQQLEQSRLPEIAGDARETLRHASQVLRSVSRLGTDVQQTLSRLDQTLAAFSEVVRMMDEDPGALLRGKEAPAARIGKGK